MKIFPHFHEVGIHLEAGLRAKVKGEGKTQLLMFDKPVRMVELNKFEALKLAFTLLGKVGTCEICQRSFRINYAPEGIHANARFCSRACYYEWCRRTGGTTGLKAIGKVAKAAWHPERLKDKANIIDLEL